MKKVIALTIIFIFAMSSLGMCAVPDPGAGIGSVQVGYNYYNLDKSAGGTSGFNEIYGSVGLGLGYGAFISHAQSSETSYTDYGLKSSLLPNIALLVGERHMATDNAASDNNLFYGVAVNQPLFAGIGVYGTYQNGRHFDDTVIGLTYDLNKNSQFDLSWKKYEDNNHATFKGIGAGINFKF
ncbi:Hypothetical protein LUCI_2440 [Lucifera butyrica]|uniref:Outer membrane protein beta-barrel domain-containing protein n=1 Tax=Lucifera butyrica TaxID=1351585 RepID=A0A498R3G3_9FIRM|nr:hypothetical protein [Lucifera butyrica]VBB07196.1 Hypothetical protein LUCI_2440 [Lucifera butyrica]